MNDELSVKAVYDSGSNATLINHNFIKQLKSTLIQQKCSFKTIGGVNFTSGRKKLRLRINKMTEDIEVFVVRNSNFSYDLLLGLDAIKKFRLLQDENLKILQRVSDGRLERIDVAGEPIKQYVDISSGSRDLQVLNGECVEDPFSKTADHLPDEQRRKIIELVRRYEKVFATGKFDLGTVKDSEAKILLLEDRYVAKKPYRCSIPDQIEIDSQIAELLNKDLIEESSSAFASPVTMAFKKEDGRRTRLCIDFRDLNKLVVPESHPFPRIEDLVVKAGKCRWFSCFDINSAFWTIPLREEDREKTAFVTQNGHYQWKRLPFGLKTSPAIFQRTLSNVIRRNGLSGFCVNYIDDILLFSENFEDHLSQIERLMKTMLESGFKLKLSKCDFAKHSVKYLGHILETNGIRPAKDNLIAIKNFDRPKNRKNVRQLLGKINFYLKYVNNASRLLEPLHNLLRKGVPFIWTDDCERAFEEIKNYLCSSPILRIYDPAKPVFIYTDASGDGLGAILKQPQEDNVLHPVAYFSRRLKPAEAKKKAIHLECLAIKQAPVYWQY